MIGLAFLPKNEGELGRFAGRLESDFKLSRDTMPYGDGVV